MINNRPTIRDVARLAGVSHQTVSRVINEVERVNPETREKVEVAIAELEYKPSAIARSMARGVTRTLACISPNLTDYTFASIIEGAEQEARSQGYFLLSSSSADPDTFAELIEELIGRRRVDGLIVINPYADSRFESIPGDFPVVFVGAFSRDAAISSVSLDDERVAFDAVQHLINLGHRKIAMITGPMEEDCSQDRSKGYSKALQKAGIEINPSWIFEGDWTATSGQKGLRSLTEQGLTPTAIFAQNDRMAMGVLRAARDFNLTVPENLSVIGVDDMPLSSYFDPPLSTMRQDMPGIGREATQMLLDIVNKTGKPVRQLKISGELVVRKSTNIGKL
ncbi:MAG: LacI family DNA-binding transcriptional regulator [Chloroflexi bacterium]|nr:LacI family DNA-binding transcriptional regulator [Chloroflexota bacterium]